MFEYTFMNSKRNKILINVRLKILFNHTLISVLLLNLLFNKFVMLNLKTICEIFICCFLFYDMISLSFVSFYLINTVKSGNFIFNYQNYC